MAIFTAAAALGSALAGAVGIFSISTVAAVAIGFGAQIALGAALRALAPKPRLPTRGYTVNQQGSALDHQVIYGRARVGGVVVFTTTTGGESKTLHQVIAYAGHEIESYDELWVNDAVVTQLGSNGDVLQIRLPDNTLSNRYAGKMFIRRQFGTANQAADADLVSRVSEWTNQHRLRGVAYLYIRYEYDQDVYPNGVPQVTATIKGKKVFDPRTNITAWSDNTALCLRDYLTSGYGVNDDAGRVDDALTIAAANVCDQPALNGQPRFTCNGAFTTDAAPADVIEDILSAMGGSLWYAQGKWRMKPAVWTAPVAAFDENDLRGAINVQTRHSRRDNFNTVRGTFRGEESDWQVTDYPEVTNPAFLSVDGGQESVIDIDLVFTDNSVEARRLARITLERNRQQLTVTAPFGLRAMEVQVGDNIELTIARYGWAAKLFEVVSWNMQLTDGLDIQITMTLRETAASAFDEIDDGIVYERDNTNLASPFEVSSIGITPAQFLQTINEEVIGVLRLDISAQSPFETESVEVQIKLSSDTIWREIGVGQPGRFEIPLAESGDYDIRARARNFLGVRGPWVEIMGYYFGPFEAPPAQPQNFTANVIGGTLHLSWSPVPDLDLSHYRILYTPITTSASVTSAVLLVPKLARPGTAVSVPAQTGTYFIQAVDKLGIIGPPASLVITTNLAITQGLNVVEVLQEHPDFPGVKTGLAVGDFGGQPALVLDTSVDFDDTLGLFDDGEGLFDAGEGTIRSDGVYDFADVIDLGEVYISRVSANLVFFRLDYADTFDLAEGLFDSREGLFDGDDLFTDVSAKVQLSYTDDDPAGSPVWTPWQDFITGDVSARAYRFRAVLMSSNSFATPAVVELSAEIDMPDRVEADSDITFTGSTTVTFPAAFKVPPALGVALANLTDGQRYAITSKTRAGFTISVFDPGGAPATNPVDLDYVAKGYGRVIA